MASTKNTLWAFGDSFTFGHSLLDRPGDDYYHNYPEKRVERGLYTELVADKYNLDIDNSAHPGASNLMIIEQIINKLSDIKEGDRIVVGMTDPSRMETFHQLSTNHIARVGLNHFVDNKAGYWKNFSREQVIASKKFIIEVRLPLQAIYERHDYGLVEKLLKSTPASHYYVWGSSQWWSYQTIYECTNGELNDGHFSWTGQQQIADDIITKWKTRKKYVVPFKVT